MRRGNRVASVSQRFRVLLLRRPCKLATLLHAPSGILANEQGDSIRNAYHLASVSVQRPLISVPDLLIPAQPQLPNRQV